MRSTKFQPVLEFLIVFYCIFLSHLFSSYSQSCVSIPLWMKRVFMLHYIQECAWGCKCDGDAYISCRDMYVCGTSMFMRCVIRVVFMSHTEKHVYVCLIS